MSVRARNDGATYARRPSPARLRRGQPTDGQRAAAAAIDAACRDHGFLLLSNMEPISPELVRRAFGASRALFALPEAAKLGGLVRIQPETNSGYAPFGTERLNSSRGPDQKEAFNVRRPRDAPANALACTPPEFAVAATEL